MRKIRNEKINKAQIKLDAQRKVRKQIREGRLGSSMALERSKKFKTAKECFSKPKRRCHGSQCAVNAAFHLHAQATAGQG